MKKFSTKKASIPLSVKKLPWYVGIPLIVVFAPILVLITAGVLLYAWIVGSKTSKEPIQQYTWKDWTRNDAFRMRVRPLRPKEFSHIADEWFNHIDTEEQSLLLYAETQPPVSPLHGSVISNFCHETEDGFFVQRIWHVEEADPAIHSELIFIQPQEGSTQVVTEAGPFFLKVENQSDALVIKGTNHDEAMQLEINDLMINDE